MGKRSYRNNNDPYPPEPLKHVTEWIKTHINDMEYAQFEDELWIIEFVNTLDKSFKNSSQETSRDSKESSISSSSCSNNTSIFIITMSSSKSSSPCSNCEFEELVFVNLNANHFSKAGNTNNGIRPDGQLICESIFPRFKMEIRSLESSNPVISSFNKKKSDKAKLILAMLMSGTHIHNDFNLSYMSQKLLEEIGYVTLQVHNENLIAIYMILLIVKLK
ncbi:hypothetical protein C2G38_2140400 [Gigaspora rosea]|uniref:Uncharacterized protein n=1 Tax=Gigaspora rosea TaxID=44941 RepID=A0A397VJJ6_9GLOM|nr:hypothetical protein C2G38_2140400 [Gigaspora rosea]